MPGNQSEQKEYMAMAILERQIIRMELEQKKEEGCDVQGISGRGGGACGGVRDDRLLGGIHRRRGGWRGRLA